MFQFKKKKETNKQTKTKNHTKKKSNNKNPHKTKATTDVTQFDSCLKGNTEY